MGKVSDGWIRDLGFNPCLHQKLIGWSDGKELSSRVDAIGWNSSFQKKIVVWLKFKLPTCGLKFDTLLTWGLTKI